MGEAQYFPSTLVGGVPTLVNGVEVENGDLALLGQTSGLADDRTLAELFRMAPFVSSSSKGILPYNIAGVAATVGTVEPSSSADGSVHVLPFRAIVGSRVAAATDARSCWRDIRTGVFTPASNVALFQSVTFTANSSGNTRWDLVYATLTIDAPSNQVTRRLKDASSGAVSITTVYEYLSQPITISVQAGTPGATPTVPALPADSGSNYNIALAAVRIPNGFGPTSTIGANDIREQLPFVAMSNSTGATTIRPANGNNDGAGTYATNNGWAAASSPSRPAVFLPPSMAGGEQLLIQIDSTNPAAPSHPDNSVVDSSVDWTDRFFVICVNGSNASGATAGSQFGTRPGTGLAANGIPFASLLTTKAGFWADLAYANSMHQNVSGAGQQITLYAGNSSNTNSVLTGSMTLGIKVDYDTGQLRCTLTNSPVAKLWLWVMASARFPNFANT